MSNFKEIHAELSSHKETLGQLNALVGFDGTVDKIVAAVDKRHGPGEAYAPIPTIAAWGQRISAAAGKSTNIELFLKQQKIGGNAAIMAGALAAGGAKTTLVGDLGAPEINEVFKDLGKIATLKTLGEPTETHAVEFTDGKVMLCYSRNHEFITFNSVEKALGGAAAMKKTVQSSDLIALVNWTMTPAMTDIFHKLTKDVFPSIENDKTTRTFFFDLADPEKRSAAELKEVLELLKDFSAFGKVVLGINLKESQEVSEVLGLGKVEDNEESLKTMAGKIRERLNIACVAIHPTASAACATQSGAYWVKGPYVTTPKITTGAGDHFNAGFATGFSLGVSMHAALTLGVSFSGSYVRTGVSPSFEAALAMIEKGW